MALDGIDALHGEGAVAEFAPDEADEQTVDVPADRRAGVDDASTPISVQEVGCVESKASVARLMPLSPALARVLGDAVLFRAQSSPSRASAELYRRLGVRVGLLRFRSS
jgi:hypothetical protein